MELDDVGQSEEVGRVGEVEIALQPARVEQQVVEDEGEALRDRVVAQVPELEGQAGVSVGEVLGVAALVQQSAVVVLAALGHDTQVDLVRHTHRRAEGARRLELARLGVDVHVVLSSQVDAHAGERGREGGQQALRGEHVVVPRRPPQVGQVR